MASQTTILIAEDDENDVFILRRAFQKAGLPCNLPHVADGEAAIAYLKGHAPYTDRAQYPFPSLMLLDLKMPKVNGFDVLAWLQTQPELHRLPVVVLSASELEADKLQVRQLGGQDYRTKPYEFDALVELVRELGARWLNRTPQAVA